MATPSPNPPVLTGDPRIDGLMEPSAWVTDGTLVLTWSPYDFGGTWTPAELTQVQAAFDAWSNVTNIDFVRIPSVSNFRLTGADLAVVASGIKLQLQEDAIGLAFTPDPNFTDFKLFGQSWTEATYPHSQGDIFLDNPETGAFTPGSSDFHTIIHEIGHALGLKHPHDFPRKFSGSGIGDMDDNSWTVMSYNYPGPGFSLSSGWPVTPMPLDILAIQNIYGPNMSYHTDNNVYPLLDNGTLSTIWDAGGIDTLDASHIAKGVVIHLAGGSQNFHGVHSMTAIAFNVTIENAVGTAKDDWLSGNTAANMLDGRAGDDHLFGGAGANTLIGGSGKDTLTGGWQADELLGGWGADVLRGNRGNDELTGGGGNDDIDGGPGNDILAGGAGQDVLRGGPGNDIFQFDTVPVLGNVDGIRGFTGAGLPSKDLIELDSAIFTSLTPGALAPGNFVSAPGPVPADGDDFILYDTATGELFYDADGKDALFNAVMLAVVTGSPDALNASDILIV